MTLDLENTGWVRDRRKGMASKEWLKEVWSYGSG